jgi:nucleotide-binding universal stress UspA family protein
MPAIKKILFPVDFSKRCVGAARYVEALAGRFEAEVILLHVVSNGERTLANELYPMRKVRLDAFLDDELKYYSARKECMIGDAAEKIVETAQSWQPDLVMMPTYGLGHFRRLLLGSTTAKILHDLECPVWTDVHAEDAPALEDITYRKILCAVGLDERSGCLLEWAAYLAEEYQGELGVVHAVPAIEASAPARFLDQEFSASLVEEARKCITAMLAMRGLKANTFIEPGEPAKVIADAAQTFGADLLVVGRHSKGGLDGHLRHNAYAILRESPCPVLSI